MEYLGIDLGKERSDICILDESGEPRERLRVVTSQLPAWLSKRPRSRLVMETSTQSRLVSMEARKTGHDVTVLPGQVLRALGIGWRGLKTDRKDAEILARAAFRNETLPDVHLRSDDAVEATKLILARTFYKRACTKLINQIKAELRAHLLPTPPSRSTKFEEHCRAEFASADVGVSLPLEIAFEALRENRAKVSKLEKALEAEAERPEVRLLRSIPGIGVLTGVYLWALIDDPTRFASADRVGSYLGLVAGEATTGGKIQRTRMIKAGPKQLRPLLVQSAWTCLRHRPHDPLTQWALRIAKRRGKKVAVCALVRKLGVIAWAVLRSKRPYDPTKAARRLPELSLEEELAQAITV